MRGNAKEGWKWRLEIHAGSGRQDGPSKALDHETPYSEFKLQKVLQTSSPLFVMSA